VSLALRAEAADVIESNFDQIVEQWCCSIECAIGGMKLRGDEAMANSLIRFIAHLRDPADLRTYVHLRRHCQEGILARAKPSEFNIFHIVLKQVILEHLRNHISGPRLDLVRDTIVAAIDERRLMVGQFYIESRERALKASEEKYRNSIDHAPDPMYEIDPESMTIMAANAAAMELHRTLPYEREKELIGANLCEMTEPGTNAAVVKHIERVLNKGSDQAQDFPISGRFFDVNSAIITAGNRRFIQMILHEVTQRHEMLDTLVKTERLAAAGTFASGVAHEINNPLASISSLVQSLLPDEINPERRANLSMILSQITRIAGTVKDLVNFGRPAPIERKALDLNELINETLRLVAYNRRFDGIAIEPLLEPDPASAYADHNGIQQVLLNLLFNAADAVPADGGIIRVSTSNYRASTGEERVKIRVADNGCGIPPENLERVFDPFFTTKPAGVGIGMGLSLCQSIVLSNHGTIKVESHLGSGTAVTICLPAFPDGAEPVLAGAAR
jgi:PAS domain S-box-containing protein